MRIILPRTDFCADRSDPRASQSSANVFQKRPLN
jgi:hypothetical protein